MLIVNLHVASGARAEISTLRTMFPLIPVETLHSTLTSSGNLEDAVDELLCTGTKHVHFVFRDNKLYMYATAGKSLVTWPTACVPYIVNTLLNTVFPQISAHRLGDYSMKWCMYMNMAYKAVLSINQYI